MPQIKKSFDVLFERLHQTTELRCKINQRQWERRLKQWMNAWGVKKEQRGHQVPLPDELNALPLCCASSNYHAGPGQHLNPAVMPGTYNCPNCGTACAACANSMSTSPHEMAGSHVGPSMTAQYPAGPNVVENWPPVQPNLGHPYPLTSGLNPSHLVHRNPPYPSAQYNLGTGDQDAHPPYPDAAPILASTETTVEPRHGIPESRKRSRRNSPEHDSVDGASDTGTGDQFIDWQGGQGFI
ncbi:MAG: hypothetical protein LQ337_006479 [Flavoplaca oasis]|nr:MAG: hypothetical protein LQ337_006479 [Flavoplaca oasis]